jgi:hypothetical protein
MSLHFLFIGLFVRHPECNPTICFPGFKVMMIHKSVAGRTNRVHWETENNPSNCLPSAQLSIDVPMTGAALDVRVGTTDTGSQPICHPTAF